MVPAHTPVTILGRKVSRWVSSPCSSRASMAPWVSSGAIENDSFDAVSISCMARPTNQGNPPPP